MDYQPYRPINKTRQSNKQKPSNKNSFSNHNSDFAAIKNISRPQTNNKTQHPSSKSITRTKSQPADTTTNTSLSFLQ